MRGAHLQDIKIVVRDPAFQGRALVHPRSSTHSAPKLPGRVSAGREPHGKIDEGITGRRDQILASHPAREIAG